jgi:hypothetical protein
MLIHTVGLQEVSERKFNTAHLISNQDFDTTQLKSNQPPSHVACLVHTTYVHMSKTNMNGQKNNLSSFSTVITNHFIKEDFYLSQHYMDGYEAMVVDVTQLTQDIEQSLFTIKTNMPIPMLVYGDAFQ